MGEAGRATHPLPASPIKGEVSRRARGDLVRLPSSIPEGLGVIAIAIDDELVLDAAHAGDSGWTQSGRHGLGRG